MKTLDAKHPAVTKGRTIYLKSIVSPQKVSLLKSASSNMKLGKGKGDITKGKWKGFPMYSLTLEERKTCPKSCDQWKNCYGNNMPFAHRIKHESPSFFKELTTEVAELATKHPAGFVVRLHVLGDFFSVPYVDTWINLKKKHPNLQIFGYTHRSSGTPIGKAITTLNTAGAWIRWSDAGGAMSANVGTDAEGITCPEQTGQTESCLTCGLCWSTTEAIRFLEH
jgi:hypothetical protein